MLVSNMHSTISLTLSGNAWIIKLLSNMQRTNERKRDECVSEEDAEEKSWT
jgi:hypothetical protein